MRARAWGVAVSLLLLLVWSTSVQAGDVAWRLKGQGPTLADLVKDSANVVFGQVTGVATSTIRVSVSKAYKGNAHDEITIAGFKSSPTFKFTELKSAFSPGQDYFFFLGAAMIGSVPFEPVKNALFLKVDRGKLRASIVAPTFAQYARDFDFEFFSQYLTALVAAEADQTVEAEFMGLLTEKLEKAAADPADTLAPTYLTIMLQLDRLYSNEKVLTAMLDSKDVNSRVLALQTLAKVMSRTPPPAAETEKAEKAEKEKEKKPVKKPAKGDKKAKEPAAGTANPVAARILKLVKTDPSRLVRSTAAKVLGIIHDRRTLPDLAAISDELDLKPVELCEVSPVEGVEPPQKALFRAIVEFESDEALDILEKELLKNNPNTFRLVLEIFKDYSDPSLNLMLLDLLQDRNFLPRQVAILEYFRIIKDDETIETLKKLFLSPEAGSEYIRKSIVEVFEDFNEPRKTADFLIQYGLHDESPVVRQAAARTLGTLGDSRMVAEIKVIYFKEQNRLAREFYVEALSKIKSRLAYDCLTWLQEKETDPRMQEQIKFAIKKSKYLSQ